MQWHQRRFKRVLHKSSFNNYICIVKIVWSHRSNSWIITVITSCRPASENKSTNYTKSLLRHVVLPFECLYDQQDSLCKCSKATKKTANHRSVRLRKCHLSFLLRPQSSTTIFPKQFKYSPSFYHKTDAYYSAEFYDHSAYS